MPSVPELADGNARRQDVHLRREVPDTPGEPLHPAGDVVVAERRARSGEPAASTRSRRRQKRPPLRSSGSSCSSDQQKTVRPPQVQESFSIAVLADHARRVEIPPFGEIAVDPIPLRVDDIVNLFRCQRFRNSHDHAAIALNDDAAVLRRLRSSS